jgi:transposase
MARPKVLVDQALKLQAEKELKNFKESKVFKQLLAISASASHPVDQVAEIFQTTKQSIYNWVKRFKENGVEGLIDLPKGHNPAKLSFEQKQTIKKWITTSTDAQNNRTNWTLVKLQAEILKEFDVQLCTTTIWNHLKELNLTLLRPRRRHEKTDQLTQDNFKKN